MKARTVGARGALAWTRHYHRSMYRTRIVLLPSSIIALAVGCGGTVERPVSIVSEMDALAAEPLWPGFQPKAVPLAIFDNDTTWLFRHPAPPPDFQLHVTAEHALFDSAGRERNESCDSTLRERDPSRRHRARMPAAIGPPVRCRSISDHCVRLCQSEHHMQLVTVAFAFLPINRATHPSAQCVGAGP